MSVRVALVLRGVNIQRLFGSQRALKTVEDFSEFEQVHFMAEFEEILDFPPAPKLDVYGKLDPRKAAPAVTPTT